MRIELLAMSQLGLLFLVLGHLAFSQVRQMALLSANTGWTQVDDRLFYTLDNGKRWVDITPPAFLSQRSSVAACQLPRYRSSDGAEYG